MKSVIVRAKEYLKQASEAEKTIIRFILDNPEEASHMGTHDLSRAVFASPSTIGRLCRKMGFRDYRDYQRALGCELAVRQGAAVGMDFEIGPQDGVSAIVSKTVSRSNASFEDTKSLIDCGVVDQCVRLMTRAESIGFFGVGASQLVAKDAFLKFIRVKKHCQISEDFDVQRVFAKTMHEKDVAVLVSYSGQTKAMTDCAKLLKTNRVPIIAITCFMESELSRLADYNLYVSATEYSFTSGKFTSRLSQLLVIDILYLAYIQATYETSQYALIETHLDKREKGETEDGNSESQPVDDGKMQ